jgi:2-polyprenyl-6-methoxyphenol hydroxylase-like FAD-dependent oxidoreductase
MIDVLVVGGGPVGLATAIRCALAGLSVTVAEPRGTPIDKTCGEGVMPAAVRRLAALGVKPGGRPLRGIRYVDERHHAEARFRRGDGLGVRRTVLHAALAERAAALDIPVMPARVTAFAQQASHVTAAGIEARCLVAAGGLHSTIRRILERGGASSPRRPAAPRYGLRRHYRVAPWTDLVEVHLTAKAEAYVTSVCAGVVGIALLLPRPGGDEFEARLSAFPTLSRRLAGAACASDVRGAGPVRQDVRRRVYGRVLLIGDASGYLDPQAGEGLSAGLAQAEVLARCLAAGRPGLACCPHFPWFSSPHTSRRTPHATGCDADTDLAVAVAGAAGASQSIL